MIAGRLHRTPLLSSETLGRAFGGRAFLKAELLQKTGSFKPRGVLTKLASLGPEERARGVISASAGNHAGALAYASALEGIDCLVVMWQGASELKKAAAIGYGATVDQEAAGPTEVFERLGAAPEGDRPHARPPFRRPVRRCRAGNRRARDRRGPPDVDVVVVPVGGGGLVSGVAVALQGGAWSRSSRRARASSTTDWRPASRCTWRRCRSPTGSTRPSRVRSRSALGRELGVEPVLVTEAEIHEGFRFLYERAKLAAEPAGAAGVAALLAGKVPDVEGATVAVVVSGGNVSGETASGILKPVQPPADP